MAPSKSSPPSSAQQKKQQSISSFFTPKPSQKIAFATPAQSLTPQLARRESAQSSGKRKSDAFQDDEDVQPQRRKRRTSIADEDSDEEADKPDGTRTILGVTSSNARRPSRRSPDPLATLKPAKLSKLLSDRTSKYLFSSSPVPPELRDAEDEVTDEHRTQREKLHQQFVKKLGKPDAIAEIKRRNKFITEDSAGGEEGEENEELEEDEPVAKSKGRKAPSTKKTGNKLTPMEKQVIEIKQKNMDTILVVEVGYKFRFFGEDARVAAKVLNIVCIPGKMRFDEHSSEAHLNRFASASIPVHRLHVHVKRLVMAGHKVGVVRQLETAALKAVGDNRNAPFVRKLTNLYTKGTYVDDVEGLEGPTPAPENGVPSTGYLLCMTETNAKGWGDDEKVHVGIVAVQPATGDIIYDDFEDGFMRSEMETRLLHIAPCEFLLVGELSKVSEKLVRHISSRANVFGDQARVERVSRTKTIAAESFSHISTFYVDRLKADSSQDAGAEGASHILDQAHQLSEHVSICLSSMIKHMTEYGLEHVFDLTKYFQPFSARSHMLLNGNTLTSLEIYQNQTDHTEKGSLFWCLSRTRTRFGHRLLRKWVGRPLLDKTQLEARLSAVEELKDCETSIAVDKLKHVLTNIKSDLEKSLLRIYYKKCGRPELLCVLEALQRIGNEYAMVKGSEEAGFASLLISEAIATLPRITEDVVEFLEQINPEAARKDDKYNFFRDDHETDKITGHKMGIASVEHDLNAHRSVAASKLRVKNVEYSTVAGIEYLIEVDNSKVKDVPASWAKISGTKKVSRFHTPEVVKLIRERDQHKESLAAACDAAYTDLLTDISQKYQSLRDCIQSLALLDCLLSLATVASQPGYVKPKFTASDTTHISVQAARHPMIEQLLVDVYVPNSISLSQDSSLGPRGLLITGPNMGGKSSYVRSVALISIMAQIGSYVPAKSASLPLLDAVFTRMGAQDNMLKGESTFMVELSETSDILKQATPRSLVLLDELGRGTSTHDGVAIASAVLDYVVRDLKALTLFITHYQSLSKMAHGFPGGELKNVHMRFETNKTKGDENMEGKEDEEVTFLYEVGEGVAHRSYGLNVARLAHVPSSLLGVAREKSSELETKMRGVVVGNIAKAMGKVIGEGDEDALEGLLSGVEQL